MSIPLKRRGFIAGILVAPFIAKFRLLHVPEDIRPRLHDRIWWRVEQAKPYLPKGVQVYDLNGQTIFQTYGMSGGLLASCQMYFVDIENNLACGVKFDLEDSTEHIAKKIKTALMNFEPVNLDGGEMPRPVG